MLRGMRRNPDGGGKRDEEDGQQDEMRDGIQGRALAFGGFSRHAENPTATGLTLKDV
jgi:hypothetical protein